MLPISIKDELFSSEDSNEIRSGPNYNFEFRPGEDTLGPSETPTTPVSVKTLNMWRELDGT